MALQNFLLRAAVRPDCLYAIFPYQNHSIVPSPLRKDTLVYPTYGSTESGSWAERNGIAVLKNLIVENDYFTALNKDEIAAIATPLNLQHNTTPKTFIAKLQPGRKRGSTLKINPVFTQGFYMFGNTLYVFNFTVRQINDLLYINITFSFADQTSHNYTYILNESFFDCWHTLALTYDIAPDGVRASSFLYIDGKYCTKSDFTHRQWNYMDKYPNMKMNIREDIETKYLAESYLAWAFVFNTALSPEEIVLFK